MAQTTIEYRAVKKSREALQAILDETTKMRGVNLEQRKAIRFYACDPHLRSFIIDRCNTALKELQRCNNR